MFIYTFLKQYYHYPYCMLILLLGFIAINMYSYSCYFELYCNDAVRSAPVWSLQSIAPTLLLLTALYCV